MVGLGQFCHIFCFHRSLKNTALKHMIPRKVVGCSRWQYVHTDTDQHEVVRNYKKVDICDPETVSRLLLFTLVPAEYSGSGRLTRLYPSTVQL